MKFGELRIHQREDGFCALYNPATGASCLINPEELFVFKKLSEGSDNREIVRDSVARFGRTPFLHILSLRDKVDTLSVKKGVRRMVDLPDSFGKIANAISILPISIIFIVLSICVAISSLYTGFDKAFTGNIALDFLVAYILFSVSLSLSALLKASYVLRFIDFKPSVKIGMFFGILHISYDSSLYIALPRKDRLRCIAIGLIPVFLFLLVTCAIGYGLGDFGAFYIYLLLSVLLLRPFGRTDVQILLEELLKVESIDESTFFYTKNKFLANISKISQIHVSETKIISYILIYFLWFLLIVLFLAYFMLPTLYIAFIQSLSRADRLSSLFASVIAFVSLGIAVWAILSFVVFFARIFHPERSKKGKVAERNIALLRNSVKSVPIFSKLSDEEVDELIANSDVRSFSKGEAIIKQGDIGRDFYIILEGSVDVIKEDEIGIEERVATLKERDAFGEIALLYDVPRTATCRASSNVKVLAVSSQAFLKFCSKFEDSGKRIEDILRISEIIRKNPVFEDISGRTLFRIISESELKTYKRGDVIIREGDMPDNLHILKGGGVEVESGGRKIAELGAGEIFGEIAILREVRRTATVRASEDSNILNLPAEKFWNIAEDDATFGAMLEVLSEMRMKALQKS